jgi:hypothetical protein
MCVLVCMCVNECRWVYICMCMYAYVRVYVYVPRWSTEELMDSLDLAAMRTTRRPVLWIFSVSWSTATLEGAHTST